MDPIIDDTLFFGTRTTRRIICFHGKVDQVLQMELIDNLACGQFLFHPTNQENKRDRRSLGGGGGGGGGVIESFIVENMFHHIVVSLTRAQDDLFLWLSVRLKTNFLGNQPVACKTRHKGKSLTVVATLTTWAFCALKATAMTPRNSRRLI